MALIKSASPEVIASNKPILEQMWDIHARTLSIMETATDRTALAAIHEARSNLELLAKLEIILAERAQKNEEHKVVFIYPQEPGVIMPEDIGIILPSNGREVITSQKTACGPNPHEGIEPETNQIIKDSIIEASASPNNNTNGLIHDKSSDKADKPRDIAYKSIHEPPEREIPRMPPL